MYSIEKEVLAKVADRRLAVLCSLTSVIFKPVGLAGVLAFCLLFPQSGAYAAENIVMVLHAPNPSEEAREKRPLKYYLPSEVDRDDVLETGGLEIRFDEARSALFLYKLVDLAPGTTEKFRVVIRDVWKLQTDEMVFLRSQIESRLQFLEGTEDFEAGKALAVELKKQIVAIEKAQAEGVEEDIEQRIENHRIYNKQLDDIRGKVTVMSDFVKEARFFTEIQKEAGEIRFIVEAKNPLSDAQEALEIKRYLPRGVLKEHVMDAQGFDVLFDPARQLYYVTKKVNLGPNETERTEVTIKNVWHIPEFKIDLLVEKGNELNDRLVGSQYEETGRQIIAEMQKMALDIKELQDNSKTPVDRISNFSLNIKRMNAIQDDVYRLQDLVQEIEHPVPQTVPFFVKPMTPDVSTTWQFIYAAIILMTALGLLLFILWWGQSKARMGAKVNVYDGSKR